MLMIIFSEVLDSGGTLTEMKEAFDNGAIYSSVYDLRLLSSYQCQVKLVFWGSKNY